MTRNYYAALIALTLAVGCTPPVAPTPKISALSVGIAGTTQVTIRGKNLNAKSLTIGSIATTILSSTASAVTVQVPTPLKAGEYNVTLENQDGSSLSRDAALSVLEIPGSDGIAPGTAAGEAFLAFKPDANRTEILAAIDKAGFSLSGDINEPFLTTGSSVCAQATASLIDKSNPPRPTAIALTQLSDELEAFELGGGANLRAIMIANSPAFDGNSNPNLSSTTKTQTRALPADLSTVRVAMLDSGINPHQIFGLPTNKNMIDSSAVRNFTLEDNANNPAPLLTDVSDLAVIGGALTGHGTAVAGVLASTINNQFPVGLESAAGLIVPVKVCERSATANVCRSSSQTLGVCYAISLAQTARPVKVINISANSTQASSMLYSALQEAASQGISIVTSAGNSGLDSNKPSNYPAFYSVNLAGQHNAIPGLMAVGSVKSTAAQTLPSDFSSEGAWVSLSAVGEGLDLAKADGVTFFQQPGTSFSAPQVAATALMLRAQNPALSLDAVKAKLISSVTPVVGCATTKCGAGLLNIKAALTP
jgi:Subtilase family/IPT/TIG domain